MAYLRERLRFCCPVIGALVLLTASAPAGDLDPPIGTIADSMPSLSQVEPRICVNTLPGALLEIHIINEPGSYYLCDNIVATDARDGIVITADNVTLDLNGFAIDGGAAGVTGIVLSGQRRNIAIVNGEIRSWLSDGIGAGLSSACRFERLLVRNCGNRGLRVGASCLIASCQLSNNAADGVTSGNSLVAVACSTAGNGGAGIFAGDDCVIRSCVSDGDATQSIRVGDASTISGCVASGSGIRCTSFNVIADCAVMSTTGSGVIASSASVLSGISADAANVNGASGIAVNNGCVITSCATRGRSAGFAGMEGVSDNIFHASTATGAPFGIVSSEANFILHCTTRNTTQTGIDNVNDGFILGNLCASSTGEGFLTFSNDNRIDSNTFVGCATGLQTADAGNLSIRNSATQCTTNYSFAAGDEFGSIQGFFPPPFTSIPWANLID